MAAYTPEQFDQLFTLIGFGTYVTFEPEVIACIQETQAIADGGGQPTDATQLAILALLAQINQLQAQLFTLANISFVVESSAGSKIDPARGDFLMRKNIRALLQQIVIRINMRGVRQDAFGRPVLRDVSGSYGSLSYFPIDT